MFSKNTLFFILKNYKQKIIFGCVLCVFCSREQKHVIKNNF